MRGNSCPNRHFFMDGDRELLQPVSSDTATITTNQREAGTEEEFNFSSPLTVKVRKEVARERREEVDLETGTRRSWVEVRELEVLDLTGEKENVSATSIFINRLLGESPEGRKVKAITSRVASEVLVDLTGEKLNYSASINFYESSSESSDESSERQLGKASTRRLADVDTSVVLMLRDNPEEVKRSACDILTKLLTNIINDPNNTK